MEDPPCRCRCNNKGSTTIRTRKLVRGALKSDSEIGYICFYQPKHTFFRKRDMFVWIISLSETLKLKGWEHKKETSWSNKSQEQESNTTPARRSSKKLRSRSKNEEETRASSSSSSQRHSSATIKRRSCHASKWLRISKGRKKIRWIQRRGGSISWWVGGGQWVGRESKPAQLNQSSHLAIIIQRETKTRQLLPDISHSEIDTKPPSSAGRINRTRWKLPVTHQLQSLFLKSCAWIIRLVIKRTG